jgi:glycosyltransferase involved in cell wall biosynthesis
VTVDLDVVIPVRDVDRYLGETLGSVRHQMGLACSVIVVDAGSVEPIGLPAPFDRDPAVRLIRSDLPLTAGAGRNRGVAEGDAPWISFIDADDVWPPESRRALLNAARLHGADIVVGTMRTFRSDEGAQRLGALAGIRTAHLAGGIVVSREFWNRVGPFDPALRTGEFVDWFLRAQTQGARIVNIADLVLERRIHLESTAARQIGDRDDYLRVVRQWMNRNG